MSVIIRSARDDELAAVRDLGRRSRLDAYAGALPLADIEEGLAQWWNDESLLREMQTGQMFVADDAGVVGVASGERYDADTWVLWKLYVAPERRSQGIGARLLEEYVVRLPDDVSSVLLEHLAFNDGAGRFYDRNGFVAERTTPGTVPGTEIVWRRRRR